MFRWMADKHFIDENDYIVLDKCYSKRNDYAHGILNCLKWFVTEEEKDLLLSLLEISKKASRNWVYEVELPSSPDFEPKQFEDGNYNSPDIITGTELLFSLVFENLKDLFAGDQNE